MKCLAERLTETKAAMDHMQSMECAKVDATSVVLIVDDDPDIRDLLCVVANAVGYDVQVAGNGREALSALKRGLCPRVILLDLMMPVMDGFGFREAQLEIPELATIPVVVMSGVPQLETRARQLGADAFVKKPFHMPQIVELLESYG